MELLEYPDHIIAKILFYSDYKVKKWNWWYNNSTFHELPTTYIYDAVNTAIPSLQMLSCIKFPLKDIIKDEEQLLKLLEYPKYIVAKIISAKYIHKCNMKSKYYCALDDDYNFHKIDKKTIIINDMNNNYYINNISYVYCDRFSCTRCQTSDTFPDIFNLASSHCYYCILRTTDTKNKKIKKNSKEYCLEMKNKTYDAIINNFKNHINNHTMIHKRQLGKTMYIFTDVYINFLKTIMP